MKKIMILISLLVTSFVLVACTGPTETIVAPEYQSLKVNGSSPLVDGELVTNYKGKSQTVLIEVEFKNPSNAAIKSINIDGYTYNPSKFLEDSTPSLVKIEVNVGEELGERIYSLDDFSFLNGESAETVKVSANNEFKLYVFKDFPEVKRESHVVTKDSISVTYSIDDEDDIIQMSTLRAELYDGNDLEATFDITDKDDATVVFNNLDTNTQYDIKVYASFDRDDTNGVVENYVFTTDTYLTQSNLVPSAKISGVSNDAETVSLNVDVTDEDSVITPGELRVVIYDPELFTSGDPVPNPENPQVYQVKTITGSVANLTFDGLATNTEYQIEVLANYNLLDGNEKYLNKLLDDVSFSTLTDNIPVPEIQCL